MIHGVVEIQRVRHARVQRPRLRRRQFRAEQQGVAFRRAAPAAGQLQQRGDAGLGTAAEQAAQRVGDVALRRAAHVAPLDEIRDEVVRAWKHEKARPLARKAADELAARIKQAGGQIKELSIDNKPVLSIDAATKMKRGTPFPSQVNGQYRLEFGPPSLTDLVEIQRASEALIDALFALKPGEVAVEADKPEENFYVLTLNKRDPVPFMSLMGPNGTLASYKSETQTETFRKAYGDGMTRLRSQAGYKPQDFPTEEQDREIERRG